VRSQFAPNPRKVQDVRNPPDLMILRNDILEIEAIEQLPLVPIAPPHHRPISQKAASTPPNHDSVATSKRLLQQNRPQAVIHASQQRYIWALS
jgi:hypothetical protein